MLLSLTYLKSENICTKRYFTAEKNAESIFFFDLQEYFGKTKILCDVHSLMIPGAKGHKARSNLVSKGSKV